MAEQERMSEQESIAAALKRLRALVIIPTYNNEKTLARVLDGVLEYSQDVLVVNDGSTDGTASILQHYPQILKMSFDSNCGKGMALRKGLEHARTLGFAYAISMDSDGQHYPSDIPVFVEAISQAEQPTLFIGARNMGQDSVPRKSSFGNQFSNFWFKVETGIKLRDTQSGFRAYPLAGLPKRFYTRKFEFEIEVIVRSAWAGVPVENIPVRVLYDPEERVSHFRPFRDFTRISILNTVLVFLSLTYIAPRNMFRKFRDKSWSEFWKESILGAHDSPEKKALSIALGVFVGIAPCWGFQTAITIALAVVLRLNKVLAFTFSHISLPPMIPLVIYASLWVGAWVSPSPDVVAFEGISFAIIREHISQYLIGSLLLATGMATFIGFLSYFLLKMRQVKSYRHH